MATKDTSLSFKDMQKSFTDNLSDDKYSNLNLNNQNGRLRVFETLTTKRLSTDSRKFPNYDVSLSNDLQAKRDSSLWNKSGKQLSPLKIGRDLEESESKKAKNSVNNSTLSLHIEAYENSTEASNDTLSEVEKEMVQQKGETLGLAKKWGISNHFGDDLTSIIQNPFEFPRQQDDQASRPELMQFTASQCLLNPNQMDENNQVKPSPVEPNDAPAAKKNAKEVGIAFVKKYYEAAISGLDDLMGLFGDNSVYVGANGKEARGLKDIRNAVSKLNLQEGKILIVSMNAAFTENGGIMVQCLANYITDESSKYGFSESFHLVPHSNGWYVRSCLFKWHDETPEDANGKDSETLAEEVEQEPKHELVNNHADETKKPTPEANVKAAAKEFKKPSNKRKGNHPKNRKLTNGISTPPPTPTKNAPPPQKDTKSPLVDAAPSTPSATDPPAPPSVAAPPAPTSATAPSAPASAPTSATAPVAPASVAAPPAPTSDTALTASATAPSAPASAPTSATAPAAPTSATAPLAPPSVAAPTAPTSDTAPPAPASVTAPAAPPSVAAPTAPTSWAACVGGGTKSAAGAVPAVTNNGNKNVKLSATTVTNNAAASDVTVKSPSTNVTTTTANGNTSADLESTQDKQQLRHNRRPARARSDFTVHVSKIFKGKKATERDLIADVTKAFQEYGPISHVRVPGRRLADDNESTMYAFVDFQEKEDYEKIFADHEKDNEGRVKLSINLPVLSFDGEVIIAQNRGNRGRNFYRNNRRPFGNQRPAGNNGRFGNGRPPQRYPRYNGQPGNRPPQQIDTRNQSDNRQKENETIKAEN